MDVIIAKAEPVGSQKVNGLAGASQATIHIAGQVPDFESLEAAENFYEEEAQRLMSALATSLPQGTIHRLLIHMLHHVKCYYRGAGIETE
jgi:hypothetical protein